MAGEVDHAVACAEYGDDDLDGTCMDTHASLNWPSAAYYLIADSEIGHAQFLQEHRWCTPNPRQNVQMPREVATPAHFMMRRCRTAHGACRRNEKTNLFKGRGVVSWGDAPLRSPTMTRRFVSCCAARGRGHAGPGSRS